MATEQSAASAATTSEPCLHAIVCVQGLSHWFGAGEARTRALDDITLEIDRGEIVILTGPSGSGKTTLLTLIGALRRVQEGRLRVLGQDLAGLSPSGLVKHRGEIGFIFQQHNLFSSLSAVENVRMATALKPGPVAEMNRRATAILDRIGMGDRVHYLPSHLSGGQRQRVAIARALVNEPSLVLADEPTASLDAQSGQEVMNLLDELAHGPKQTTVLIVTHDQRLLDRAHRIVNLVSGRLVSNVQPSRVLLIGESLKQYLPLLKELDAARMTRVVEHMKAARLPAGIVLAREGDEGDEVFVILKGEAEELDAAGRVARVLAKGDAYGRITSISGKRIEATLRSRTALEIASLKKEDALAILAVDQDLNAAIRQYLLARQ